MAYSNCSACKDDCRNEEFVELFPCACRICIHCALKLQVEATGTDTVVTCCGQVVVKYKGVKVVSKRHRLEENEYEVDFPQRKRFKSATSDFVKGQAANQTLMKTMGEGFLLTEPHPDTGKPRMAPLAFSAVPRDGKDMDDEMIKSIAEHFSCFHSVLLPSSKTRSAPLLSVRELLPHIMMKDKRATLLCMLVLTTGFTDTNEFKKEMEDNGKSDVVPNAAMAIGMATDLVQRTMNPKEVGFIVKCMSNIIRHAGDKVSHGALVPRFWTFPDGTNGTQMGQLGHEQGLVSLAWV